MKKIKPYKTKEGYDVYGCSHTHNGIIIMKSDAIILSSYLDWKDTTGWDGDKTECFNCYCKRIKNVV